MQALLDTIGSVFTRSGDAAHIDTRKALHPNFVRYAEEFYSDADDLWEPVILKNGKVFYLLRDDKKRDEVSERMVYLDKVFQKAWARMLTDPANATQRKREMENLRRCLGQHYGVSHIVQKPLGGYDVRAYAHDSWIFIELPTFKSVEDGSDGVNTTEDRRRQTLVHIILHELAHVAGHWEHDTKHSQCIAWLSKYVDSVR